MNQTNGALLYSTEKIKRGEERWQSRYEDLSYSHIDGLEKQGYIEQERGFVETCEDVANARTRVSYAQGQSSACCQSGVDDGGVYDFEWSCDPADGDSTLESFVGRVAHGVPKRVDRLNIGCGPVFFQGWWNVDCDHGFFANEYCEV